MQLRGASAHRFTPEKTAIRMNLNTGSQILKKYDDNFASEQNKGILFIRGHLPCEK